MENDLVYSPLEQVRDYYPYFDLPIGVDILLLSGEEFQRRLQAQDDFISRIEREGMTLGLRNGREEGIHGVVVKELVTAIRVIDQYITVIQSFRNQSWQRWSW